MITYDAHALTADWLNGWLAAIGVTLLVPRSRLSWSAGASSHAVFVLEGDGSLVEALAASIPSLADLDRLVIARAHDDAVLEFPRNVTSAAYRERAELARRNGDLTLAATVTDLGPTDRTTETAHSPLDPPAPKGITIWERLRSCRSALPDTLPDLLNQLDRSLRTGGVRIKNNGLGFDYRRILTPTDPGGDVWVDPVIEVLAFFGMTLLPVRGDGMRDRARGWSHRALARGSFTWPAWRPFLNGPAIDALLDLHWTAAAPGADQRQRAEAVAGVSAVFRSVPYQPRGQMDQTRAYASERLR